MFVFLMFHWSRIGEIQTRDAKAKRPNNVCGVKVAVIPKRKAKTEKIDK